MSGKFSLFLRLALLSCTSIILFSAVKITPEELSIKKARASTGFLSPLLEIPIAGDDTATVDEAGTITMLDGGATSVLANDTISSGTTIVDTNQTVPPAHGSLNLNANGTFSYTHDGSETTSDSFNYAACDSANPSDCDTATVDITITPVNDPPNAVNDSATVAESGTVTTVNGSSTSLLANDSDPESNNLTLTTTPVSGPTNGSLTLNANGTFIYTHNGSETASDSFVYEVCDDGVPSMCSQATVDITITPVNDIPIADDKTAVVSEDNPTGILLTGSDVETCELTFSIVNGPSKGTLGIISNAACASGVPNTDSATVIYTPDLNATGSDSFTYKVNDGTIDSLTATVSITITGTNDIPIADGKAISTNEDTATGITLSGSDVESCELTFSIVSPPAKGSVGTPSNIGCIAGTPNTDSASVTYTPTLNANGPDSFTYKVNDSTADSLTATVSITINPVNDAPTFVIPSNQTVDEDSGPISVQNWATNISAGPPDEEVTQSLTSFQLNIQNSGLFLVKPSINLAGTLTFTPEPNANGASHISVTLQDDGGTANGGSDTSASQTFTITVNSVNDAPIALSDPYDVKYGEVLNVDAPGVLDNDQDVDGDPLTAQIVSQPANGILNLKPDGSFSYSGDANFTGVDTFTYRAYDGTGYSDPTEVEIEVYDGTKPRVEFIGPIESGDQLDVYNQTVILKVNAEDDIEVDYVLFYWWDTTIPPKNPQDDPGGYVDLGIDNQPPFEWKLNTSILNPDFNQIFAKAYDNSGNESARDWIWLIFTDGWRLFLPLANR